MCASYKSFKTTKIFDNFDNFRVFKAFNSNKKLEINSDEILKFIEEKCFKFHYFMSNNNFNEAIEVIQNLSRFFLNEPFLFAKYQIDVSDMINVFEKTGLFYIITDIIYDDKFFDIIICFVAAISFCRSKFQKEKNKRNNLINPYKIISTYILNFIYIEEIVDYMNQKHLNNSTSITNAILLISNLIKYVKFQPHEETRMKQFTYIILLFISLTLDYMSNNSLFKIIYSLCKIIGPFRRNFYKIFIQIISNKLDDIFDDESFIFIIKSLIMIIKTESQAIFYLNDNFLSKLQKIYQDNEFSMNMLFYFVNLLTNIFQISDKYNIKYNINILESILSEKCSIDVIEILDNDSQNFFFSLLLYLAKNNHLFKITNIKKIIRELAISFDYYSEKLKIKVIKLISEIMRSSSSSLKKEILSIDFSSQFNDVLELYDDKLTNLILSIILFSLDDFAKNQTMSVILQKTIESEDFYNIIAGILNSSASDEIQNKARIIYSQFKILAQNGTIS